MPVSKMLGMEIFFNKATTASMVEWALKNKARPPIAGHYLFGIFYWTDATSDLSDTKTSSSETFCCFLVRGLGYAGESFYTN